MSIVQSIKLIAVSGLAAGFLAIAAPLARATSYEHQYVCPAQAVTGSNSIVTNSGTASVTFTVAQGCQNIQLSLVSYEAPSATFSQNTADQQVLFDSSTDLFGSGSHSLSVDMPNCYFQVDLVYGLPIEHLGPANSNNFYSAQNRLIQGLNGGTTTCEVPQPQNDCDNDTDNSPQTECETPGGGQGGGPTTTPTTPQVLGTSTSQQVAVVPQGSVNGGEGAASRKVNKPAILGLVASLIGIGSGLALLNRRSD